MQVSVVNNDNAFMRGNDPLSSGMCHNKVCHSLSTDKSSEPPHYILVFLQVTNVGMECSSLHVVMHRKVPAEDVGTFLVR